MQSDMKDVGLALEIGRNEGATNRQEMDGGSHKRSQSPEKKERCPHLNFVNIRQAEQNLSGFQESVILRKSIPTIPEVPAFLTWADSRV